MTSWTVGVDMATEPERTAAAVIEWHRDAARVSRFVHPCTDGGVVDLVALGPTGIDCALGWPRPFLDFLGEHRAGRDRVIPEPEAAEWRRRLSMRTTDRRVTEVTGRRPLSVSTDRLGLVAVRTASILARLRDAGFDTARDGSGRIAEVYPAAALRIWGIASAGYKRDREVRADVVAELGARMPWLRWGSAADAAVASDHVLDAVVCALLARCVAVGSVLRPSPAEAELAREEGWIMLPTIQPGALLAT